MRTHDLPVREIWSEVETLAATEMQAGCRRGSVTKRVAAAGSALRADRLGAARPLAVRDMAVVQIFQLGAVGIAMWAAPGGIDGRRRSSVQSLWWLSA
jgi:hypothetical protein